MVIQVTAYVVLDRLVVQATAMEAVGESRSWTRLVFEDQALPTGGDFPSWDALDGVAQALTRAVERAKVNGPDAPF